jgi:hypothetical protein
MGAQILFGLYLLAVVIVDPLKYFYDPYLSPMYSPLIPARFYIASFLISPALLIGWVPLGFRVSCYYYRKAYYRAFGAPPACGMKVPDALQRLRYTGERRFPWVVWNLHRYFLYAIIVVIAFLLYDGIRAFIYQGRLMIGLGTLLMAVNVVFLWLYVLSCHSFRHFVGGSLDCYSCDALARTRRGLWNTVTRLNERHGLWALASLFTVWGADIYIRLLLHGVITDPRIVF